MLLYCSRSFGDVGLADAADVRAIPTHPNVTAEMPGAQIGLFGQANQSEPVGLPSCKGSFEV